MAGFVREFGSLASRWSTLAAMLAMLFGYLAVTSALPDTASGSATSTASWLYMGGCVAVYASVQYVLVRSLARRAGQHGRPRAWAWLGVLLAYVALTYVGAI